MKQENDFLWSFFALSESDAMERHSVTASLQESDTAYKGCLTQTAEDVARAPRAKGERTSDIETVKH